MLLCWCCRNARRFSASLVRIARENGDQKVRLPHRAPQVPCRQLATPASGAVRARGQWVQQSLVRVNSYPLERGLRKSEEHILRRFSNSTPSDADAMAHILAIGDLGARMKTERVANEIFRLFRSIREMGRMQSLTSTDIAVLVRAHSTVGNHIEAYSIYHDMVNAGPLPRDLDFFECVMRSMTKLRMLPEASKLLNIMQSFGLTPEESTFSILILGHAKSGNASGAWRLFRQMVSKNLSPSARTGGFLMAILTEHGRKEEIGALESILDSVLDRSTNMWYQQSLLAGFVQAGNLQTGMSILESMRNSAKEEDAKPLVAAYTAIMSGIIREATRKQNSYSVSDALKHLDDMKSMDLKPTIDTYTVLLHGLYMTRGYEQLLTRYNEWMKDGIVADWAIYNILMRAHVLNDLPMKAVAVFNEMIENGLEPNIKLYTTLITALALTGNMSGAVEAFNQIEQSGVRPDLTLFNVIINGYAYGLDLGNALAWYNKLLGAGLKPDVVTYTILMYGVSRSVDPEATNRWYDRLFSAKVRPNVYTYSLLLHNRMSRGDMSAATQVFDEMVKTGVRPNEVTYTTVLDHHVRNEYLAEAVRTFHNMLAAGTPANKVVYHVAMKMFTSLSQHQKVVEAYNGMVATGIEPDTSIYTTLYKAHVALGNLDGMGEVLVNLRTRAALLGSPLTQRALEVLMVSVLPFFGEKNPVKRGKAAELLSSLYSELRSQDLALSTEVFRRIIRSELLNCNTAWVLDAYADSFARVEAPSPPAEIRDAIFTVLDSQTNLREAMKAMAVSIMTGCGEEDSTQLDRVISSCHRWHAKSNPQYHATVLDAWLQLGQHLADFERKTANFRQTQRLPFSSSGRGPRNIVASLSARRKPLPATRFELPISTFINILRLCVAAETSASAVDAVRSIWSTVSTSHPTPSSGSISPTPHLAAPLPSYSLYLEYFTFLATNGLWDELREFLLRKEWTRTVTGDDGALHSFERQLRELSQQIGGLDEDLLSKLLRSE
ncbi:hypothetical protein DFJ73DRAFT_828320 [Zopfochytrium polystomum]|nr:hypothetical protein DFJ73DRAFT_828320 [Zopfochytrium polystomum]